jgi:hypothetical protein
MKRGPKPRPKPMEDFCPPPSLLSLRSGESHAVEDDAEKRLADGRRASSQTMDDRTFYLSREQVALRQSKEVLNMHGVPDGRLYAGLYRRTFNPLTGQRPTGQAGSSEDG